MGWVEKKSNGKRWAGAGLFAVLSALSAACASSQLKSMFANEFDCQAGEVNVEEIGGGRFRVTGCGRTVFYECDHSRTECSPTGEDSGPGSMASSGDASHAQPIRHSLGAKGPQGAHVERKDDGNTVALDLRLDEHTLLKLRATPSAKQPKIQLLFARVRDDADLDECENGALINGERVDLPKGKFVQKETDSDDANAGTKYQLLTLPAERLREFAVARKLSLKTCDLRWSLDADAVAEVRHFAELYQEELAWAAPAHGGEATRLIAPPGGWPDWKPATALPATKTGSALDGPALFKLLSPSVFEVVVETSTGTMQGSAVAVSANQLLTNCHVLESAQKVTLHQGKKQIAARIAAADPANDRCVLAIADATLTPIRGMRQRSELEIGEALFTLGTPNGLELSISNGVLSGIREEDGHAYLQTTAPISPGSSGGGLFDARGNLVGITTLVLIGSEHLNQSLNFAIPSDAFVSQQRD